MLGALRTSKKRSSGTPWSTQSKVSRVAWCGCLSRELKISQAEAMLKQVLPVVGICQHSVSL